MLTALGIRFVGERTAELLAEAFGGMDEIAGAGVEELQQAEEVGPKVAESICQFFREPRNRELVERLRPPVCSSNYQAQARKAVRWPGMTFVLTGTLPTLTREEAKAQDRSGGRKSERRGEQEDQLRGGRRGRRLEAGQGARAGGCGDRRTAAIGDGRERSRIGLRPVPLRFLGKKKKKKKKKKKDCLPSRDRQEAVSSVIHETTN